MKDDLQIIVCPKCGATDLEIEKDQSLIKCDYCGTTFMVPQNEVAKQNLQKSSILNHNHFHSNKIEVRETIQFEAQGVGK